MSPDSYENFCSHQFVSRETYEKFKIFHDTLTKWQRSINLISKFTLDTIWLRHILDSAQLYKFIYNTKGNIFDLGSGAGFPGLILAIMGCKKICLVEPDKKKCTFLREVAMLTNTDVTIYNSRIQDLGYQNVEVVISRALASLVKLIQLIENYMEKAPLKKTSYPKMIFLKGKSYYKELNELSKIRKINYNIYTSITDKYGKILYLNNVKLLNISHDKKIK